MNDSEVLDHLPRLDRLVSAVEERNPVGVRVELEGGAEVLAVLAAELIATQRAELAEMRGWVEVNRKLWADLSDARARIKELRADLDRVAERSTAKKSTRERKAA